MSDDEGKGLPPGGLRLGGLGADEFDTTLGAGEPAASDAAPELPRGALLSFRKSGGLRFTTRGVLVTRAGWVFPLDGAPGRKRHLTPTALVAIERLLLRAGLTRVIPAARSATRDGYSYELTVRVAGRVRHVELADPMPPAQARLLQVLSRLLPQG